MKWNIDVIWISLGRWLKENMFGQELESGILQQPSSLPQSQLVTHLTFSFNIVAAWMFWMSWFTTTALSILHCSWDTQVHLREAFYSLPVGATSSQIHSEGLNEYQSNLMIFFLYPVAKQPALFCLKPWCPKRNITSLVWRVEEW